MSFLTRLGAISLALSFAHCSGDFDSASQGPGNGTSSDIGNPDGGTGDLSAVCEINSLGSATQNGFFSMEPMEEGGVDKAAARVFITQESDSALTNLVISIGEMDDGTLPGPGSYPIAYVPDPETGSCNPCIIVSHDPKNGEEGLFALASAGTLEIQSLETKLGGKFAGQLVGLELIELIDEGMKDKYGDCKIKLPTMSFDVTLAEDAEDPS